MVNIQIMLSPNFRHDISIEHRLSTNTRRCIGQLPQKGWSTGLSSVQDDGKL
jgi:hypothetical protein